MIVGSGPAGVMAAWALRGKNVLMLDPGFQPAGREAVDRFSTLIGSGFESLHNLHREPMSIKLKSPLMRYVTEGARELSPVRSKTFEATMSFAAGGLANAWGSGVYRFNARDLEGFPIGAAELEPYYTELTRHIGVSGANDDLSPWFGEDPDLQTPVPLSRIAGDLLAGYGKQQRAFASQRIAIGHVRHAVLTKPHRGRNAYSPGGLEFFRPHNPAIYTPAYTLRELIDEKSVAYRSGYLAIRYRETESGVEVTARNLATGTHETFTCRKLILAAGALNSAKLALASADDCDTRLPVLDNPLVCLPFFRWKRIGQALNDRDISLGQLIVVQEFKGAVLQGTIFGTGGPLRSDILFDLPFSIGSNAAVLRRTAAATGMLMMFYPAAPHPSNYLRLTREGVLEIEYAEPSAGGPVRGQAEKVFSRLLRKIGFHALPALCRYPPMGSGIHYAGTLPMQRDPERYQLHPDGRLRGTRGVYVADGACFPRLPAKNLTFTIMANAIRIASGIREREV